MLRIIAAALVIAMACTTASGQEVRLSVKQHNTAIMGIAADALREDAIAGELEFAGDEIGWGLTPFALASWSGAERTNFIAAGVEHAFDFGGWTVRPALGAAVHDGCITGCAAQVNLGSRALFYLRLDVVHAVSTHWSLGLRLEHLSNAGLGAVNPGMEEAGLVLSRKF